MARVLAISSEVARGYVGLSAIRPALQHLGHDVISLPTVFLSQHPGHGAVAGERVSADLLRRMGDALLANGALDDVEAIVTGYVPDAAQAAWAADLIRHLVTERPRLYLCDPVLGDHPKGLYVDRAAAEAVRARLVPLADLVTPNPFELSWLVDDKDASRPGNVAEAQAQMARISAAAVLLTSAPAASPDGMANLLAVRTPHPHLGAAAVTCVETERLDGAPNGTGDLLSGLMLGHLLGGTAPRAALEVTTAGLEAVVRRSLGSKDLRLFPDARAWAHPQVP